MTDQRESLPLSVLFLQLKRQRQSRVRTLGLGLFVVIAAFGSALAAESVAGLIVALLFAVAGGIIVSCLLPSKNRTIRTTQDQIAVAQSLLPPDKQVTVPQTNTALYVTVAVGVIGAIATVLAAIIGRS